MWNIKGKHDITNSSSFFFFFFFFFFYFIFFFLFIFFLHKLAMKMKYLVQTSNPSESAPAVSLCAFQPVIFGF